MPKKTALFVDFDNVFLCLKAIDPSLADCFAKRPAEWLKQLESTDRRFLIRRCYMNPSSFEEYRSYFIYSAFDVIDCPPITKQGKTHSKSIVDKLESLKSAASMNLSLIDSIAGMLASGVTPPVATSTHTPSPPIRHVPLAPTNPVPVVTAGSGDGDKTLPIGERNLMIVMVQFEGATPTQLTVMTGYKRSSRNSYLQRARGKGFITESGGKFYVTQEGINALGSYELLPTGKALQEYWLRELPEGEAKILQVLLDAYPNAVSREQISEATGYLRSSRNSYIQRMRSKMIHTEEGDDLKASALLFD